MNMTKILIFDYYHCKLLIIIILNRFMPLFEVACHIKYIFKQRLKTLLTFIAFLYIESLNKVVVAGPKWPAVLTFWNNDRVDIELKLAY